MTVYLAAAGAQGAPATRPSLKRALVAGTDLVYPDRHSEPRGLQGWRSARRPSASPSGLAPSLPEVA